VSGPQADTYIHVPFVFKERTDDGALHVYGKVTGPQLDLDEQIVDEKWAKEALAEWFEKAANIRQMHSASIPPAGKGVELEAKGCDHWLKSRIVEPGAQRLVEEGVYTGYSIGIKAPRIIRDPQAPNGRIVGGKIVEVSVVDYPALESAKFVVAKAVEPDGHVEYVGSKETEPEMEKRDFDPNVGGGVDREKIPDEDFVDPDRRRFPIVTPGDVSDAVSSYGRAKPPIPFEKFKERLMAIARRKGPAFEKELPQSWKDGEKDGEKSTAKAANEGANKSVLKRLHDLLCPAYDLAAVLFSYPEVAKDGLVMQLGPDARRSVWQLLQNEVEEDGGTGTESVDIQQLAEVYSSLCGFVRSEAFDAAMEGMEGMLLAARADERKAFEQQFPGVYLRPGDPPPPGTFRRPAIGDGQARASAPSADKNPPMPAPQAPAPSRFSRDYIDAGHARETATGSAKTSAQKPNPPEASEFDRPPLKEGQQEVSPGNSDAGKPSAGSAGRVYYTQAARDQMRAALRAIHDSLAALDDQICPMGAHGSSETIDTGGDSVPEPVKTGAVPDLVKRDDDVAAQVRAAVEAAEAAKAAAEERAASLAREVEELKATVEKLAAEPDPRQAPFRGTAVPRPAERKSATNDAILAGREQARREEIELLNRMMASAPEPAVKAWARERLAKMADTKN
jgi:phage head maturation protease